MLLSSFICDFSAEQKICLTTILLRLQGQSKVHCCALKFTQKLLVGPLRVTSITLMLNSRPWLDAMNRYHYSARCTLHAYKCIHVRDERVTCGSKNEHNKRHFSRWFVLFSFCIKLFRFQAVIKLWTLLENYRIREHFAAMNEIYTHTYFVFTLSWKIEYGFLLLAPEKKILEQRGRLKELQLIVFELCKDFILKRTDESLLTVLHPTNADENLIMTNRAIMLPRSFIANKFIQYSKMKWNGGNFHEYKISIPMWMCEWNDRFQWLKFAHIEKERDFKW